MKFWYNFGLSCAFISALSFSLTSCGKKEAPAAAKKTPVVAAPASATVEGDKEWEDSSEAPDSRPSPTAPAPLAVLGGFVQEVGEILEGQVKEIVIPLKNTSDEPWMLQEIDASCSCTNVDGIPGGQMMEPHKEWPMRVRIDGSKIAIGEFSREIILSPADYKTVKIQLHGRIKRFVTVQPASHVLKFTGLIDPAQPWETEGQVKGVDDLAGKLKLALAPLAANSCLKVELIELKPGEYQVKVTPSRPLPYISDYSELFRLKVVEPAGYPDIKLQVSGRSGMTLSYSPGLIKLTDSAFDAKGVATCATQLGFDPYAEEAGKGIISRARLQAQHDAFVDNVDWQKLFDALVITAPEKVTVTKTFTRFGVRLDFSVPKSVFATQRLLDIQTSCHGNPFKKIELQYVPPPKPDDPNAKPEPAEEPENP